jgi:hypothetical protein
VVGEVRFVREVESVTSTSQYRCSVRSALKGTRAPGSSFEFLRGSSSRVDEGVHVLFLREGPQGPQVLRMIPQTPEAEEGISGFLADVQKERQERGALHRKLKLLVSIEGQHRNEAGRVTSVSLKVGIANTSKEEVFFYAQGCGACFWAVSTNGADYRPASELQHKKPCSPTYLQRLAPGEVVVFDDLRWGKRVPCFGHEAGVESIQVRYRYWSRPTGTETFSRLESEIQRVAP